MTGAPVPPGCDGIVPVEQVETTSGDDGTIRSIRIRAPVQPGRHIRLPGEDFGAKDTILSGGSQIEPHAIMAIAATGTDSLTVRPRPRFSVISTGSELATAGIPSHPGLIRDSNGPYLAAFIRHIGAGLERYENVPDSAAQLRKSHFREQRRRGYRLDHGRRFGRPFRYGARFRRRRGRRGAFPQGLDSTRKADSVRAPAEQYAAVRPARQSRLRGRGTALFCPARRANAAGFAAGTL